MATQENSARFRDALDIVFENRNKKYGAYALRREEDKRLLQALLLGICTIVAVFLAHLFLQKWRVDHVVDDKLIKGTVISKVEFEKPPPPPPKPLPLPKPAGASAPKNLQRFLPPVLSDEEKNKQDPPPGVLPPSDPDTKPGRITTVGDPDAIPSIPGDDDWSSPPLPNNSTTIDTIAELFTIEKAPGFPGGEAELFRYLSKHIVYPRLALENNLSGIVHLSFVVNKDGSISAVTILKDSAGGGCGKEAVRVVEAMPRWTPGEMNGKAVRVRFTLPVRFEFK